MVLAEEDIFDRRDEVRPETRLEYISINLFSEPLEFEICTTHNLSALPVNFGFQIQFQIPMMPT